MLFNSFLFLTTSHVFGLNLFYSGIKYTVKDWVQLRVQHYPIQEKILYAFVMIRTSKRPMCDRNLLNLSVIEFDPNLEEKKAQLSKLKEEKRRLQEKLGITVCHHSFYLCLSIA